MSSSPTSDHRRHCLVISGTGRKGGYCDHICDLVKGVLRDNWLVDTICMDDMLSPQFCTGCGACRTSECPIIDGFSLETGIMDKMDLVVFVSPIRFSGLSSQMKFFVDRMNPLWYSHEGVSCRSCAVLVGGSPEPKFSNAESELKAVSKGCGMRWSGVLELSDSDNRPPGSYDDQVTGFVRDLVQDL